MRLFFFMIFLPLTFGAFRASAQEGGKVGAVIKWEEKAFDFGDISQGDKIEHTFRFENAGTEPLVITNVTTQCGCTAPKGWPRDPVLPGGKGEITLAFNSAGKYGRQNKVATVISNAANGDGNQLLLSGNVLAKKP